ncbi:MAG TPA: hypothetical protein VI749_05540 [Candidatus Omnitrophota bacterium]|nr:hypothetical protein [Candidatus Omnitrophota bacterium]
MTKPQDPSPNPVTRAELWGLCFAFFSFLFVVHMASTITFVSWFHGYVAIVIVASQLICLWSFFKYMRKK